MAKLNKKLQEQTKNAPDAEFEPIPAGLYHTRLRTVDTTKEGPKGPYWVWEFEIVEEEQTGRRVWLNTSLAAAAAFKLKEVFQAFGVDVDADTDDLCGQIVLAQIGTRVIQGGSRKGEIGNDLSRLKPKVEGFQPAAAAATSAKDDPNADDAPPQDDGPEEW